jgi:tetratricopeptide (TPR) repeat protein
MEIREPLPPRHQGNVENFVVILLGIDDKSNIIHSIVNFVKILNNSEELNSFIITLKFEKIILIVNDQLFESIEDLNRFYSIYLLSNNFKWIKKSSNIRGHFSNIKLIFEKIKEEFLIENHLFSIESVPENETQNQSFSYSQLLKETLLTKDDEANLKKDFIDFSRFHYYNNQIQLNLIEEFQTDFTLEKSIWWFTRNSFIRKMLNRALRTEEIDILFKMRWIIQAINNQIKENHFSKIVYRIHHLSSDQFQKLKEHSGGLISFRTFLDCSLNEPSEIENINEMETILFRIKTTIGIETEQLRHFDSKTEILLPLDNVYHIESIEKSNQNCWIISLININKDNQQFKELTNSMREDIQGPVVLIQLGKLLISNNDYLHADYLARLLFNDNSLKDNPTLLASLAALHHLLGSVDNRLNNYRAARLQFEQSLKIFLTFISEDNQILSATYNNIGSMFYQEDQHDQAIIYHQKALQCQLKSSSPDIEAIATYSGNIGAVYLDQRKYDQALLNYKRSLQILQQSTPGEESQSIAMVYDRIASVYWRMDQPDQALPYYQKALQLELKYLPQNDHKISVSYFNLSTAYAKLNRLDDAIDCAEKSVQQLLKSVPPDHPEVKENTTQLEGLRRRKLLQQIYQ